MITASDHSPYFFGVLPPESGTPSVGFVQKFYCPLVGYDCDAAVLQFFTDAAALSLCEFVPEDGGEAVIFTQVVVTEQINESLFVHTFDPRGSVEMWRGMAGRTWRARLVLGFTEHIISEPFGIVTDEDCLTDTLVLKYSHGTNVTPYNTLFVRQGQRQEWEWRVPAGMKASGYAAQIDNEDFRNQRQEVVQLFDAAFSRHTLTLGHAAGVPYYYGGLLNRLLSCDSVEAGGRRIRRSGNSVPQLAETFDGSASFHITQEIEIVKTNINI